MRSAPVSNEHPRRSGLPCRTPVPPCLLQDGEGNSVALQQFLGPPLLVVFSHPACPPCHALLPDLEALARRAPDVRVLVVSCGAPGDACPTRLPVYYQEHWEVSKAFRMFQTPAAFLIGGDGTVAADVAVGPGPILTLLRAAAIRSLLLG